MNGRRAATIVIGMALAVTSLVATLLSASPLTAQDRTFSLPTATASPRAQGPVDNDNPIVISTPRPEPSAAPTASPSAAPSPRPSAAAPAPRPAVRPTTAPTPALARPQAAPSQPAAATSPAPLPSAAPSAAPAPSEAAPLPVPSPSATAAPTAESPGSTNWPLFGGIALLALLLSFGLWKKRRKAEPETSDEPEWLAPAEEPAPAPPEPAPAPAHAPVPVAPIPSPVFAAPMASPLACTLEAKRISATLLNAQLDYRIELVNESDQTIELIAVHADMIGAHASLGNAQLAEGQSDLPVLHRVPRLAAGERVELTGSIRLPLAQIQAVRQGSAALFVPLVRLRTQATMHDGWTIALPQSFVIGEPPLSDGSGLRPFRLDMGPRIYSQVLARIVTPTG